MPILIPIHSFIHSFIHSLISYFLLSFIIFSVNWPIKMKEQWEVELSSFCKFMSTIYPLKILKADYSVEPEITKTLIKEDAILLLAVLCSQQQYGTLGILCNIHGNNMVTGRWDRVGFYLIMTLTLGCSLRELNSIKNEFHRRFSLCWMIPHWASRTSWHEEKNRWHE